MFLATCVVLHVMACKYVDSGPCCCCCCYCGLCGLPARRGRRRQRRRRRTACAAAEQAQHTREVGKLGRQVQAASSQRHRGTSTWTVHAATTSKWKRKRRDDGPPHGSHVAPVVVSVGVVQNKAFRIKDVENAVKADREFENSVKLRNRASTFPLRANPSEGSLISPTTMKAKMRGPSGSDTSVAPDDDNIDTTGKVRSGSAVDGVACSGPHRLSLVGRWCRGRCWRIGSCTQETAVGVSTPTI